MNQRNPLDNIWDADKNVRRISYPSVMDCQDIQLRNEIESRVNSLLKHATDVATPAWSERFGTNAVDGKIQARGRSIRSEMTLGKCKCLYIFNFIFLPCETKYQQA